jgi:hypothetical protein
VQRHRRWEVHFNNSKSRKNGLPRDSWWLTGGNTWTYFQVGKCARSPRTWCRSEAGLWRRPPCFRCTTGTIPGLKEVHIPCLSHGLQADGWLQGRTYCQLRASCQAKDMVKSMELGSARCGSNPWPMSEPGRRWRRQVFFLFEIT